MYNAIIHQFYVILWVYYPKTSLLSSSFIPPICSSTCPPLFLSYYFIIFLYSFDAGLPLLLLRWWYLPGISVRRFMWETTKSVFWFNCFAINFMWHSVWGCIFTFCFSQKLAAAMPYNSIFAPWCLTVCIYDIYLCLHVQPCILSYRSSHS